MRSRGRASSGGRGWVTILVMASVIATLYTAGWLWQDLQKQRRLASRGGLAPKPNGEDSSKHKPLSVEDSIFRAECSELRKREALLQEQLAEARTAGYLVDTDISTGAGTDSGTGAGTGISTHVKRQLGQGQSAGMVGAAGGYRHVNGSGGSSGSSGSGGGGASGDSSGSGGSSGGGGSRKRLLAVVVVSTGFEDRLTRDAVRNTWMPTGAALKKLEEEMGVVLRFAIGRSPNVGDSLDRAVAQENEAHQDIIIMEDHEQGDGTTGSHKVKSMMAAAVRRWPNAEFYFKVNDDVYLSVVQLSSLLQQLRLRDRLYIGCFKSGAIVMQEGNNWYEPEWPKFGEGKMYPSHAAAPVYGFTREIARYIAFNRELLHDYANEDTSVGTWMLALSAVYQDERRLCCASPPAADCTRQREEGHACVAVFDWRCGGLCEAALRMGEAHRKCE